MLKTTHIVFLHIVSHMAPRKKREKKRKKRRK